MRREVSTCGYGTVTANMIYSLATALKADKRPWVQAYCYLAGRSRRGDTLDEWGALWLDKWLDSQEEGVEPRNVSVAQVGHAELTRELFGGQRKITQRAIDDLIELGLIQVVAKGKRGNVTLYFMGFIDFKPTKEYKNGDSVPLSIVENPFSVVPLTPTKRGTFSAFRSTFSAVSEYKRVPVTCENSAYSIGSSIDYSILRTQVDFFRRGYPRPVERGRCA